MQGRKWEAYRPSAFSALITCLGKMMRVLQANEMSHVAGGWTENQVLHLTDGGSGNPGGGGWAGLASAGLSGAGAGVTTAFGDCSNGAQTGTVVGAGLGFGAGGLGGAGVGGLICGTAGCVFGVGFGLIRDLGRLNP